MSDSPSGEGVVTGGSQQMLALARQQMARQQTLEAARTFAAVLAREPQCVEALAQLGFLLFQFNQLSESLTSFHRALDLAPAMPKLNLLTAAVYRKLGRLEESAKHCVRETELCPADADAWYNLGLAQQSLEKPLDAISAYRRALELRPGYVDAMMGLGLVLRQTGDHAGARQIFERIIVMDPNHAKAHWELATILLSHENFERGWPEYEWRLQLNDRPAPPHFSQPKWDGSLLHGRSILLHGEQGFGDIIQFSRFAATVAALGGRVIMGCPAALLPIMETVPGVAEVVVDRAKHPPFDVHASLLSLPAILGTTPLTLPNRVPYVFAPPPASNFPWSGNFAPGLKVGLVWAAESASANARLRSVPLKFLEPLWNLEGVQWCSLQAGAAAAGLALAAQPPVVDWGSHFAHFGQTAQAVQTLDLVITVDTSVAHLAGAMGKPVWTLLPFDADWRWMQHPGHSPWYPTMRLFRQARRGDWTGPVSQIRASLLEKLQSPKIH